jgi:hypothetical protein
MMCAVCPACGWSRKYAFSERMPLECGDCPNTKLAYGPLAPTAKLLYCRWSDCLLPSERPTGGNLPDHCPHCRKGAMWSTEPITAGTVVSIEPDSPDPLRPWDLWPHDRRFLRVAGIASDR